MTAMACTRVACLTGLLLAGCDGKGFRKSTRVQATEQWNAARASAMTGLAADQLKDGNFDKCQQTLDQILRLQPADVNLHLLAAKLSIEQGRLEVAEAHLAEARKLAPTNAEADYLTGMLMERWQQPERARQAYADAGAKNPTEVSYLLAEAEMFVALGQPRVALAVLEARAAQFEHNGVVRHEIGLLQAATDQPLAAVASLRQASRLVPDDPVIREHLAFTLFTAGQFTEAVEVLDRLVKNSEYDHRPDVHAALGECRARVGRLTEAHKAYDTATKLDPGAAGYWLGLARVAAQTGDFAGADLAVRKAVSLRPATAETHCLVGYVRLKQGQLAQAVTAFRAAAELDPRDSVSVCLEGYVLARLNRPDEARACYARALKMDATNDNATRLLATLDVND